MPLAGQIIRAQDFAGFATVNTTVDEVAFTSASFVSGATVCGVTFVAPTSGTVVVHFTGKIRCNTAGVVVELSVEARTGSTIGSGTIVSAASGDSAIAIFNNGLWLTAGNTRSVTGLTPGATYNVRTMHQVNGGGSSDILYRSITVLPGV